MTFVKCNYLAIYLSTFTKKYSVQHTLLYIVGTINGRILYVRYKDGTRTDWLCTRTWARLIVCRMCVRYVEKSEPVVNYSILLKFDVYDFLYFSFGKRVGDSARRQHECLVLEPSEMIVVRSLENSFKY